MLNLYRETALAPAPTPALDGDLRTDVVVVGGGFTGLSTALHLAEKRVEVVLLEAEDPGWGASGRNGGQVNPGLKSDPDEVERDFGPELGRRMNALAGGAPDVVFALIKRCGIECEARRNGTLRAAVGRRAAASVRTTFEQWLRRGAPVEWVEGAALEGITGTARYVAALHDRRGGDVNPLSFARGLARAALEAGAAIHGTSRVLALARRRDEWLVRTGTGTVTARHVVLATNGYTDSLWPGLARTVVPVFGAIAATAPLPSSLLPRLMPGRAVLYESGAVTVYYRVDAGGRLLIGGRGPMREIASASEVPHLCAYAARLWPEVGTVEWTHAWGGRLAMTWDHYPHLHQPAPGIIACLGYNGRGVALSTALGAQIAGRIADVRAPLDLPVSGIKPLALHALWPLAVRAAIARGRISDRFGW